MKQVIKSLIQQYLPVRVYQEYDEAINDLSQEIADLYQYKEKKGITMDSKKALRDLLTDVINGKFGTTNRADLITRLCDIEDNIPEAQETHEELIFKSMCNDCGHRVYGPFQQRKMFIIPCFKGECAECKQVLPLIGFSDWKKFCTPESEDE